MDKQPDETRPNGLRNWNTVAQVAEHWGVCERTVRRRLQEGSLVYAKLGGVVRIAQTAIEAYEAKCRSGDIPPGVSPADLARRAGRGSVLRQLIEGKPRYLILDEF